MDFLAVSPIFSLKQTAVCIFSVKTSVLLTSISERKLIHCLYFPKWHIINLTEITSFSSLLVFQSFVWNC